MPDEYQKWSVDTSHLPEHTSGLSLLTLMSTSPSVTPTLRRTRNAKPQSMFHKSIGGDPRGGDVLEPDGPWTPENTGGTPLTGRTPHASPNTGYQSNGWGGSGGTKDSGGATTGHDYGSRGYSKENDPYQYRKDLTEKLEKILDFASHLMGLAGPWEDQNMARFRSMLEAFVNVLTDEEAKEICDYIDKINLALSIALLFGATLVDVVGVLLVALGFPELAPLIAGLAANAIEFIIAAASIVHVIVAMKEALPGMTAAIDDTWNQFITVVRAALEGALGLAQSVVDAIINGFRNLYLAG